MSYPHGIDNEDPLFNFDPLATSSDLGSSSSPMTIPDGPSSEGESTVDKGKGREIALPMPIMISPLSTPTYDEYGAVSPPWSTSSTSSSYNDSTNTLVPSSPTPFPSFTLGSFSSSWMSTSPENQGSQQPENWKGKGKAAVSQNHGIPPTLPPLLFSPTGLESPSLLSATSGVLLPGPSTSQTNPVVASEISTPVESSTPQLKQLRRHSFPYSTIHARHTHHATPSISSIAKFKMKLGSSSKIHSNLARKLLSKKPSQSIIQDTKRITLDQSPNTIAALEVETNISPFVPITESSVPTVQFSSVHGQLQMRLKNRSNSSPYPLSVLDIVPATSQDIFVPIPVVVRNHFDEMLPRELKLEILSALVTLHQNDHSRAIDRGEWTSLKAASLKNRWLGIDRAIKDLVRLGRVSKSWQMLVFDGQLWNGLNLRSFPSMSKTLLMRLASSGGHFITTIDLSGHVHLSASTLQDITDKISLLPEPDIITAPSAALPFTRITSLSFRGCTSLNTRSLHGLLVRSPTLQRLCLKGLSIVTNTTCDILAMYNPRLVALDLSRCSHMDAEGIRRLAAAAIGRGEHLQLKELRLGGLRNVTDSMMATLGKATPYLEVLDLANSRQLHNSAVEAFISCDTSSLEYYGCQTITVINRDGGAVRKRVTRLRHISLSSCLMLTDHACTHLAHAVPALEFFEMAGIGEDLKDDGLVKLLETTPMIRRLDLEDATDITDKVLEVLTPSVEDPILEDEGEESVDVPAAVIEPGFRLEQLIVSYASNFTDTALLELIRRCTRLTTLEADNTRIGSGVLKEFVSVCRKRKTRNARFVAVDCRLVGENVVKEMSEDIRPRLGWRGWEARKLKFLDGRDFGARPEWESNGEESDEKDPDKEAIMKVAHGQDELDERRVVVKTFYSWQTVDSVWAARDKRRKDANAKRRANNESDDSDVFGYRGSIGSRGGGIRWWSPGGRRSRPGSGANSPNSFEMNTNDGCNIM